MQELLVISGKGGTGKTSLAAAFAVLARDKVLVDCDVDAADLHLLLRPQIQSSNEFWGMPKAFINAEDCNKCGLCQEACRFGAIEDYHVNPHLCEGCGVCSRLCPAGAVVMRDHLAGYWYVAHTPYGPMVHAQLGIAEDNSGKLVTVVRQAGRELARERGLNLIIIDGPPGIGCPVIAALSGVSLALVVTEPTVAGHHDLERIMQLAGHFRVPVEVCINKFDLAPAKSREIEEYCRAQGVEVISKIPFDEEVAWAVSRGVPLVQPRGGSRGGAARAVRSLWEKLAERLDVLARRPGH
ncbi:MAG TPA: (4Fe-4S)-binding protein [Peptococcaceae bacterium]|nr:(4Fe-4S)-binding protein [Peptococcaceae bacterium]